MMADYILRFEATDFARTLFDVEKISAIRGASLSYLYSSRLVEKRLSALGLSNFSVIYTGASQGAFRFSGDAVSARHAATAVRQVLRSDDAAETGVHSHLSYAVALVEGADMEALARAEALCALESLQGEGWSLPALVNGIDGFDAEGDRHRPADTTLSGQKVSSAFAARTRFGREQRAAFYGRMLGGAGPRDLDVVDSFEEMVGDPPPGLPLSLSGKVGVMFADGNRLGLHRARASDLDGLTRFSEAVKDRQSHLLRAIVAWMEQGLRKRPGVFDNKGRLRFETLMWGGDEVLFVLPSWLALEFADTFFRAMEAAEPLSSGALTFSAGLVICDAKTPIRQSKAIAEALADLGKAAQPNDKGQGVIASRNILQMEVFESLSLPVGDFGAYRDRLYFVDAAPSATARGALDAQLCIEGSDVGDLARRIARLKLPDGLPRSQLYRLLRDASDSGAARARSDTGDADLRTALDLYLSRAGEGKGFKRNDLDVLKPHGAPVPALALSAGIAAMLWDYVDPLAEGG